MSIGLGSVMQLTLLGSYNNSVQTVNVFHYKVSEYTLTAISDTQKLAGYAIGLWKKIATPLRAITSPVQSYNAIVAAEYDLNTASTVVSTEVSIPLAERQGTGPGDVQGTLPSFVTWTFRYTRPSSEYRHGYKRFSGVPELYQASGFQALPNASFINNATSALADNIGFFATFADVAGTPLNAAFPVLLRKTVNGQPLRPVISAEPSSVDFIWRLGSQTSRKFGVGN